MTTDSSHTRRRVLQLTGGLALGALSGCLGFLSGSDPTVFKNVSVEGKQIAIQLTDDTNADAIDFRSPNDELLHTASVGRKSTVTMSLYKKPTIPYPPGKYTLVAVETSGDEPQTLTNHSLDLTSSFDVTNVRPVAVEQSSSGNKNPPPVDERVTITIKNTGNLPVGITSIGFTQGVPSPDFSSSMVKLGSYKPLGKAERTLLRGEQNTYTSYQKPLRYSRHPTKDPLANAIGVPKQGASWNQIQRNHCNGTQYTSTLLVATTRGKRTFAVTIDYGGTTADPAPLDIQYACTNVSVVGIKPTNSSTPTS